MDTQKHLSKIVFSFLLLSFCIIPVFQINCGSGNDKGNESTNDQNASSSNSEADNTDNEISGSIPAGTLCIQFVEGETFCAKEENIQATRTVSEGNVKFQIKTPFTIQNWDQEIEPSGKELYWDQKDLIVEGSIPEGASLPRDANIFLVSVPMKGDCEKYQQHYKPSTHELDCVEICEERDSDDNCYNPKVCGVQFSSDTTIATGWMKIESFTPESVTATFGGNLPLYLSNETCCESEPYCQSASFNTSINSEFTGKLNVSF